VIQQGQVFKLKAKGVDGEPLWAYRYRLAGRGSARLQSGGFATRAEAQKALQNKLARVGPGGRGARVTLAEWVEEYLQTHAGERVTIAKLRWLLGKATAVLGDVRLAHLSPEAICAWRLTVPEGHRFEATQALRQVLNRAVAWKLIEENPAKRGVPNPGRRCREQRPFESWEQIRAVAGQLGPAYGPMVVFAAATGLRPSELFALEHGDVDREAGVVQIRRAYANGRVKQTKTRLSRRAVPLQAIALEALEQLRVLHDSTLLFPNSRGGYVDFRNFNRRHWKPVQKALGINPLRDLYDLRHTYATFALRAGVRRLAFHGHEHRDDRPALRSPRRRQLRTRGLAARWTRGRAGRGRWVDAGTATGETATFPRLRRLEEDGRGGRWTLGGRRDRTPPP
jgi:integrase